MENAEEASLGHKYDKELGHDLKNSVDEGGFHYFNAKKINILDDDINYDEDGVPEKYWERALSAIDRERSDPRYAIGHTRLALEANRHFSGIPVNTSYSSVHVPTNVYDGGIKLISIFFFLSMKVM